MAFEPLQTDERVDHPTQKRPDMDSQMLSGCSSFVAASLLTYAIGIWPFFLIPNLHLLASLGLASALGLIPASLFGAFVGWRGGLAPACGFFGGSLTIALFLYLSLQQVGLGHTIPDLPRPDYPASFGWMFPVGWSLWSLTVSIAFAQIGEKRREFRDQNRR